MLLEVDADFGSAVRGKDSYEHPPIELVSEKTPVRGGGPEEELKHRAHKIVAQHLAGGRQLELSYVVHIVPLDCR